MPHPTASGKISSERFKRGSQNCTHLWWTVSDIHLPDVTRLATSGRLPVASTPQLSLLTSPSQNNHFGKSLKLATSHRVSHCLTNWWFFGHWSTDFVKQISYWISLIFALCARQWGHFDYGTVSREYPRDAWPSWVIDGLCHTLLN